VNGASEGAACPLSADDPETVVLAHGGGGRMMHRLLEEVIFPALGEAAPPPPRHDGAVLDLGGGRRLAFVTDAAVVRPRHFPGGDLGSLAVHGAINDLAMCGARPLALALALVLEEGLPLDELRDLLASAARAARAAGVSVVTGDTKVVGRGEADGIFLTVSGIGLVRHDQAISPGAIRPGDAILLSGDLGRHGIAVLAAREGFEFETAVESDSAPLHEPVLALLDAGIRIHCLRDLTRGGLAAALHELMRDAGLEAAIREPAIPVHPQVRAVCDLLGFDPLHLANEGRMIALVPEADADRACDILRGHPVSQNTVRIGQIRKGQAARVVLESALGTSRIVEMPAGELLPRIC
jgi:hydrogenase expression/formation protein HypE